MNPFPTPLRSQIDMNFQFDESNTPTFNAFLGTLLTWGLTAFGAAVVFLLPNKMDHRVLLDASLGFAGGVMVAASFWSLLAPSIEKAEELGYVWSWFPAAVGFGLGGIGIAIAEKLLPEDAGDVKKALDLQSRQSKPQEASTQRKRTSGKSSKSPTVRARSRSRASKRTKTKVPAASKDQMLRQQNKSFRRIMLLVVAITIHNFPEGLAVGVGFGSVGKPNGMKFKDAIILAWGIGLQNFPEGLAVSLPLYREGMSMWKSFFYGQLSGMVEPLAGVAGALLVQYANPTLPYALSFAAGAMMYVVVDDLIPEVSESGNTKYSSAGFMVGFIVMMVLDVALG